MHGCKVQLKDGSIICGNLWEWHPQDGWFAVTNDVTGDLETIEFDDVVTAVEYGQRVTIMSPIGGETVDLLEKAKKDGWMDK